MLPFHFILPLTVGIITLLNPAWAQETYAAIAGACSDPQPFPGRFCLINSEVYCFAPDICMDGTITCIKAAGFPFPPITPGQLGTEPLPSPAT